MIPKPLDTISEADIRLLVESRAEEGERLDFKRELPKDDHEGKKAFYSDICAFANTAGGDLVYGVEEVDGFATQILPQQLPSSVDGYLLKLTSGVRDNIEPRVHGVSFSLIELAGGGYVLVVRVLRSKSGMHRYRKDGHFYVRRTRSNDQLDVPGVISRVSDFLGREDRLKEFFAQRYADILANQLSVTLQEGPKLVVHLVPVRDFLDGEEVNVWDATVQNIPLFTDISGYSPRNTYDGRAFFRAEGGSAQMYTLLMHNGVIEAVTDLFWYHWKDADRKLDLNYIEQCVLQLTLSYVQSALKHEQTGVPFLVRIALLGTNDKPFTSGARTDSTGQPYGLAVRQKLPVLTLPEVLVESDSDNLEHLLYPAFLRMWQAWGYQRSLTYKHQNGIWLRSE